MGKQLFDYSSIFIYELGRNGILFLLGETNLIYCSTGPTDPVFARKKKVLIWILRLAIYNLFFVVAERYFFI